MKTTNKQRSISSLKLSRLGPWLATMALLTLSWPGQSRTGGGLVGNGAGLVEQNIFYAYEQLPLAIHGCLDLAVLCGINPIQGKLLRRIQNIAMARPGTVDRIRFSSDRERPGFFETEVGQAHRLARTGKTPSDPIYWNRDQLYLATGGPALKMPALTAIWVHELGHQAGIADHAALDELGSKVRQLLENRITDLPYDAPFKLTIVNFPGFSASAALYFNDGNQVVALTRLVMDEARCEDPQLSPTSWSLSNGHWESRLIRSGDRASLVFGAWLKVGCLEGTVLREKIRDFRLRLSFQEGPGGLQFSDAQTLGNVQNPVYCEKMTDPNNCQ